MQNDTNKENWEMSKFKIRNFGGCDYYIYMEKDQFLAFVREYDLPTFVDNEGKEFSWYNGLMIGTD